MAHHFQIKAVGPVGPSFLVVKKSHFNENIHLTASLQTPQNRKVHVGSQYSKTCLKQPLKKDKTKKWWLNEDRKDCSMLQGEHPAILLTYIKR